MNKERKRQIELAALAYYNSYGHKGYSTECNFTHGAQWADRHLIGWHDLRKDPEDLPFNYPELVCENKSKVIIGESTVRVLVKWDNSESIHFDKMKFMRSKNEPKETWQWYSSIIDRKVIAWMEIPKFK